MNQFFVDLLTKKGVSVGIAEVLSLIILALLVGIVCVVADLLTKIIAKKILTPIIRRTKAKWDDYLLERKFFNKMSHLLPALILYIAAPMFMQFRQLVERGAKIYFLVAGILVLSSLLDVINDVYSNYEISKIRPIKGFLQVIRIALYIVFGIVAFAIILGESPLFLLSGIGALAAVFSLVFKDSILGLVAGIQLTANDMLRIGDWIEMSKYGADGTVIELSLNTVKVQNFDKTIVSIPAYALVSDSFRNWRGMMEAGGRRIKRSIYIDTNSIKFCSQELLEKFKKIHYLKDYILEKEAEIEEYNNENNIDDQVLVNGRRLTNVGVFRVYIQNYLKNHPKIHKELTLMVRQLQPGDNGLPIEIYVFTNETTWSVFEGIQADIFDHVFAVVREFDLRVFQNPTGQDFHIAKN